MFIPEIICGIFLAGFNTFLTRFTKKHLLGKTQIVALSFFVLGMFGRILLLLACIAFVLLKTSLQPKPFLFAFLFAYLFSVLYDTRDLKIR